MGIVDSHCHIDLIEEKNVSISEILNHASSNNVTSILQIATDLESSKWNQKLVLNHAEIKKPQIYWSAGLHPENASDLNQLVELFDFIKKNRKEESFWGIGETGLDYFHTTKYKKSQIESFEAHMQLASDLKLPVVIHTRDDRNYNPDKTGSIQDALAICKKFPNVRGVLHCFTYTQKEAAPFVDLGWYISYSGVLTFKNAKDVQQGALQLPLGCLLVETDAPFLSPAPHRGKTNMPGYVSHTLDFLVELRSKKNNEDPRIIRESIFQNSIDFLNLKNSNQMG